MAVKVQRPDAVKVCALDFACFALTWKAVEIYWKWRSDFDNGDIGEVVDTVAARRLNSRYRVSQVYDVLRCSRVGLD